eukprot:TRINITY_DN11766_c0_g1_i1.p1 TRINITY_DN11766_c0_g1~~TRINITY_DN11766_c0_g1_i1.p1  ORF type:complete len:547 (+),score=132.09 TRINITY_DN11766_c0_g1_i1:47-1687(+)
MNPYQLPVGRGRGRAGRGLPLAKMPTQMPRQAVAVARPAAERGMLPKPPRATTVPSIVPAPLPKVGTVPPIVPAPLPKVGSTPKDLSLPPHPGGDPPPFAKSPTVPQPTPQPEPQPSSTELRDYYKLERRLAEIPPPILEGIPSGIVRIVANHTSIPMEANILQMDEDIVSPPDVIIPQDIKETVDVDVDTEAKPDAVSSTPSSPTVSLLLLSVEVKGHSHSFKMYVENYRLPTFTGSTPDDLAAALKEHTNGGLDLTGISTWFPFIQLRNKEDVQATVFLPMLIEATKPLKAPSGSKMISLNEASAASDFLVRLVADSISEFASRQCTEIIWDQLKKNAALLQVVNNRKKEKADREKSKRDERNEAREDIKRKRAEELELYSEKCREENVGLTEDDISELMPARTIFMSKFKLETTRLLKALQAEWITADNEHSKSGAPLSKITSSQPDLRYKRALSHFCGPNKACVQRSRYAAPLLSLNPDCDNLKYLTELLQLVPKKGSIYNMHQISEEQPNEVVKDAEEVQPPAEALVEEETVQEEEETAET